MAWIHVPNFENYPCSPVPVADCSPRSTCSDSKPCATSKSTRTASKSCKRESATGCSTTRRSGTTCGRSTGDLGVDAWISSLAETRVRPTATLASARAAMSHLQTTSFGLLTKYGHTLSCGKTLPKRERTRLGQRIGSSKRSNTWVIPRRLLPSGRVVWEATTSEQGCSCSGLLPTPTASQTYKPLRRLSPSEHRTEKPRSCLIAYLGERNPALLGCYLRPAYVEDLMMWPLEWTDLEPLATAKFRQWLRSHGKC